MKPTICPTVTATDAHEYQRQMSHISQFAVRVHIDLSDGFFAPRKLIPVDQVWWPGGMRADIHVMYRRPFDYLPAFLALQPQMIIVHAEAEGDFESFAKQAHKKGIETGVALLQQTSPELLRQAIKDIDYVLIFSGNLGHYGGQADLHLLEKIKVLKEMKPQLEIGWDGGINDQNALALAEGGVEVLNAGGFIQNSPNPQEAYEKLQWAVSGAKLKG